MSENKINRIKEYCKENIKENKKDKLQFIIEIICKLIILFPLNSMGVPIVEFVRKYKFSAGYTCILFPYSRKNKKRIKLF